MPSEQDNTSETSYQRVRMEGTRDGLVAYVTSSELVTEAEISELGNDLLSIVELAIRIDMPLFVNFRDVEWVSSALIGKVVVASKFLRAANQTLQLCEMSPQVEEVFRRFGGGGAGSMSLLS